MNKIIVANWKMNPMSEEEAFRLIQQVDFPNVIIVPPYPFLPMASKSLKQAKLGAQNAFWEGSGAYTGEISPEMLKRMGVHYVILGHSERRGILHETDEMVINKVRAALRAGLTAIVCVGERKEVRRKGTAAAEQFVIEQLKGSIPILSSHEVEQLIVAYEPVWSVGTGNAAKEEDVSKMAHVIKKQLMEMFGKENVPKILYGGSVNPKNARKFARVKHIDGVLLGGASLHALEFKGVMSAMSK